MNKEYILIACLAISSAAFIAALITLVKLRSSNTAIVFLRTQLESSELLVNQLQLSLSDAQKQLILLNEVLSNQQIENEQVSKQLELRIKQLSKLQQDQHGAIEQLALQQPEDKLYSRAQKLVSLGADVAELMSECDLPQAEAEMLVTLHQKSNT
ncbi:MAG: DUF2802 domain-containing protein [Thalassotalea sp.]